MKLLIESVELSCSLDDEFIFDSEKALTITNRLKDSYPETTLNQELEFLALSNKKEKKFILISTFEIKIEHRNVSNFQNTMDEIIQTLEGILDEFNIEKDKVNYSIYTDILRGLDNKERTSFLESINKSTFEFDFSMLGAKDCQTLVLLMTIKLGDDSYIIGVQPYKRKDEYYASFSIRVESVKGFTNVKNKLGVYKEIIDNSENFIYSNFIK